eukprot:CAMPEP_0119476690 /NCGR_PEP_ID=MMETSP1344-20130328/7108_1 /TAXON_ID=236787 /ORGANISM="Florenciella parvula, Strain CCMP2471" /LENGTH=180 /DNA_ID=CAMNT_0007510501 /DNA_START=676 /DNA_END=1215 /DNA_ORIENTATION=-
MSMVGEGPEPHDLQQCRSALLRVLGGRREGSLAGCNHFQTAYQPTAALCSWHVLGALRTHGAATQTPNSGGTPLGPQTRTVVTWEALRNRAHVGTLALRVRGPDVVRSRRKRGITRGDVETPIRTVRARTSTKWTGAKACRGACFRPSRSLALADAPGYRSDCPTGGWGHQGVAEENDVV